MKHYLLGGSINPRNRGDQARIKGTLKALKESGADIRLTLLSHNYEEDLKVYGEDGIDIIRTPWSRNEIKLMSMALAAASTLVLQTLRKLSGRIVGKRFHSPLQDFNGFVIVSGIDFSDYVGRLPMYYCFFLIALFRLVLGVPVMLYAQSMGPVEHPVVRSMTRFFLNRVKVITLREEYSGDFLRELNITGPQVYLTADPAFLLKPELAVTFTPVRRPVIGVTASPAPFAGPGTGYCSMGLWYRVNRKNKEALSESYFTTMSRLCDSLVKNYGASLVFVPNCLAANDDDRISTREIYRRMEFKDYATCIEEEMTLAQTMAAIGRCDLFIGTRLHAEIFASIQGVPVVPLVGTAGPRVPGVMRTLGLESYICNITESPNGKCFSLVNEVWQDRRQYAIRLAANVAGAHEKALENIRILDGF